jgi:anaerobic selenocysteine-containing dehydrogenase
LLEEYYALSMLGDLGIGIPHMDGNTRLCTATAAMALIESFGTDGDPVTYNDFDVTDAVFLFGHNMAETQTVLWARVLDRLAGPKRPQLLVVDPRRTATAKQADIHLAPRAGTNLPNDEFPFLLTTGRVVYHWHTRTKTGRVQELNAVAPEVFVQISGADAQELGISEGDMVDVVSRRGKVQARARVGDIEAGHVFIPFHYGYWDKKSAESAADELTLTGWTQ